MEGNNLIQKVEVSCGGTVQNNLTYFISPGFPELWTEPRDLYYTLPTGSETREAGDLPSTASTRLSVRMRGADMPRLWLLRLAQMPLAHAAPHDCRQYYTANNALLEAGPGGLGGPGTGFYGPDGAFAGPVATPELSPSPALDQGDLGVDTMNDMVADDTMLAEDPQVQEDEMEGSGADPQIAPAIQPTPVPSMASRIWSYIWPPWLWQWQSARTISWSRWSPYAQHFAVPEDDKFRYSGYGLFGIGLAGRQGCKDRITIPCENEYFVSSSSVMSGVCDPHHCGSSFCPNKRPEDCHVDTSISPFAVSVHFGPPSPKPNPEENIGACLRYTQMPCET
ncbi:hypothetical protein MSG28_013446 [Choristoneura fumiferana]|uniref:Uncharacterized protein n=1 Tax=Choristoneura fumiferana TaxID=7141 RepID=A0ACC0KT74_CHOFU|nr:hypothetical protein MSG28_013446 [Choristoneura fumiferana]